MLKTKKIPTQHTPKDPGKAGFSLIELIITMAIVTILMSIASFMAWQLLPNIRLKSAARDLFGNMQQARLLSVKNQITVAIVFDQPNNLYALCTSSGADTDWTTLVDNSTEFTVTLADYKSEIAYGHGSLLAGEEVDITKPFDDNITYSCDNTDLPPCDPTIANVLLFQPTGNGLAGYVYLDHKDRDTNVIAVGTTTSGKVTLQRRQGGVWK